MTAKSALDCANFAGRALSEVDRPDAYNSAVRETIKFRATQKKQAAWLAEDETRADLIKVIGERAYDKGGFWASMKEAYDNWGGLTAGQEAAVRRSLDQDAARKAERTATPLRLAAVELRGRRPGSFEVFSPWLSPGVRTSPSVDAASAAFAAAGVRPKLVRELWGGSEEAAPAPG